jgi:3-oxoacid CoA-transferase B subunit
MVKGMGGAMDLVASPTRCVVTMEHTARGEKKILNECTLPLTGKGVVDLLITEMAVFDFKREGGMTLTEIAEGETIESIKEATECDFQIGSDLKTMDI